MMDALHPLRWTMPAMALALLTTGCATDDGPAPLRVDHTTASTRAAEPAPMDPTAGGFTRAWRTDLRGPFHPGTTTFAFAAGHLLTISSRGADAIGTRDGAARWRYHEPGREVRGYVLTNDTLVLVTQQGSEDARTVALDAATGEKLWDSTAFGAPGYFDRMPAGQGVAVLRDPKDESTLAGVDARTGARRWTWPGPRRESPESGSCGYTAHDSDDAQLVLQARCYDGGEAKVRMLALDPRTGRPVWQRPATTTGPRWAVSRAGLTLLPAETDDFTGVVLLGRDGRELSRLTSRDPRDGSLAVVGDRAVIAYGDKPADERSQDVRSLAGVDVRTGKVTKQGSTGLDRELAVGDGRVYGEYGNLGVIDGVYDAGLLPAGLEAIDPRTLRTTRLPLPSARQSGFWGPAPKPTSGDGLLLDGGRAYVLSPVGAGGIRVTGYVPGDLGSPPELGVVPAGDWPDACELGAGLDGVRDSTPNSPLVIGSRKVSRWSCDHSLESGRFEVRTVWVAGDAAEADRMLDPADGPRAGPRPLDAIGDEAYRRPAVTPGIVLRVGRRIALVIGSGGDDPRPMAERVARNLQRLDP